MNSLNPYLKGSTIILLDILIVHCYPQVFATIVHVQQINYRPDQNHDAIFHLESAISQGRSKTCDVTLVFLLHHVLARVFFSFPSIYIVVVIMGLGYGYPHFCFFQLIYCGNCHFDRHFQKTSVRLQLQCCSNSLSKLFRPHCFTTKDNFGLMQLLETPLQ